MPTLLMRLSGVLQSWGTRSQFGERDTQLEPSKSGVIGLACAALGRDRHAPIDDLCALKMGVRVLKEGEVLRDFQTVKNAVKASGASGEGSTVLSLRYYLADADFLVGLEAHESTLLQAIHQALRAPVWPLFLGRKSCPPTRPVFVENGIIEAPLLPALCGYLVDEQADPTREYRVIIESDNQEGSLRFDEPVAPFSDRRFGGRFVKTEYKRCI